MECYDLSGGYDYLLKIVVRSAVHYQETIDALLATEVGIIRFSSYIVLRLAFIKDLPTRYSVRKPHRSH